MEEIFKNNGFSYGGVCTSCGGNMSFYTKPNYPDKRIKIGRGGYWVQQKMNAVAWSNIDFGALPTLQEKINKWFA